MKRLTFALCLLWAVLAAGQGLPVGTSSKATSTDPLIVDQGTQAKTAFGDLRTAEEIPEVHLLFANGINPALTGTFTADGGTTSTANSMITVSTSTNPAGQAHFDSVKSVKYTPGQGLVAKFTAVFTACVANQQLEIGLDNDQGRPGASIDGLLFGCKTGKFGIIHRNAGSDTFIPQTSWNQDTLGANCTTGPCPSGVGFDPTIGNVYKTQMQYLGFGPIFYWIENPQTGAFILVHREPWGGSVASGGGGHTTPSLSNPTLGLHIKVQNSGSVVNGSVSSASMGLAREGKADTFGFQASAINRKASLSQGVATELVAIKVKNMFGPDAGSEITVRLRGITIESSNDVGFALILNPTQGGTPAFADVDSASSVVQVDTAGTTVGDGGLQPNGTGGRILRSPPNQGGNGVPINLWSEEIILNPGDVLVCAATAYANGSTNAACEIAWTELD